MILQEAILHIPLSQYAFANSEMNLTIRIRVAKDNLTDCVLWYGDRVQPGDPIVFTAVYMKKILSDMHFDYYDATFETPYDRVCYYFELKDPVLLCRYLRKISSGREKRILPVSVYPQRRDL